MTDPLVTVWTTLDVPGFHKWPEAPDPVKHLRRRHRHLFGLTVEVSVGTVDRSVEFQLLQTQLGEHLSHTYQGKSPFLQGYEFGIRSCESIAGEIMQWLQSAYPNERFYNVSVSEDKESGATVRRQPWS